MSKVKLAPGVWGSLTPTRPLYDDQIEARAHDLLRQLTLDEKIHQMSGDTPFLSGTLEMMRAYNTHPLPASENLRPGGGTDRLYRARRPLVALQRSVDGAL